MKKLLLVAIMLLSLNFIFPYKSVAGELSPGGTIYVPIYKAFYFGYGGATMDAYRLTSTACFHNTDPKHAIEVYNVEYYDSNGTLLNNCLFAPITIKPWTSKDITMKPVPPPEDLGSHLIVRWKSDQPVNPPLVEVLMVGQVLNRGASFLTRGQEIKE
jgi:hypothetical protein